MVINFDYHKIEGLINMKANIVLAIGTVMIRREYSDEENIPKEHYENLELLKFPEQLTQRGLCYSYIIPPADDSVHVEIEKDLWNSCVVESKFKETVLHGYYGSKDKGNFICNDNLGNRQLLRRMLLTVDNDQKINAVLAVLRDTPITGNHHISITM